MTKRQERKAKRESSRDYDSYPSNIKDKKWDKVLMRHMA